MQEVVTNLGISRIEARDEHSIDVIGCLRQRTVDKMIVDTTAEYVDGRAATLEAFRAILQRLRSVGVAVGDDPNRVRRFMLLQKQKDLAVNPPQGMEQHTVFRGQAYLGVAMMLAQGVELASSHGCASALAHFRRDMEEWRRMREEGGRQKMALSLREELYRSEVWHAMLCKLAHCEAHGSHPKLAALCELLEKHFKTHPPESRVMVFTSLRDSVTEITARLTGIAGVRPFKFVGQASKRGDESRKGLTQTKQRQVVRDFRSGGYNVLVSTSIGEEGLDIGEVDLIACYDVSSSAIRQTQRFGRTGRKNAGRVVMLITQGIEEDNYERSIKNANVMKRALAHANDVRFVTPVGPSLLPPGLPSRCEQRKLFPPDDDGPSLPSAPELQRRLKRALGGKDLSAALDEPVSPREGARLRRWALLESDGPLRPLEANRWIVRQMRPAAASNVWASCGRSSLLVHTMERLMGVESDQCTVAPAAGGPQREALKTPRRTTAASSGGEQSPVVLSPERTGEADWENRGEAEVVIGPWQPALEPNVNRWEALLRDSAADAADDCIGCTHREAGSVDHWGCSMWGDAYDLRPEPQAGDTDANTGCEQPRCEAQAVELLKPQHEESVPAAFPPSESHNPEACAAAPEGGLMVRVAAVGGSTIVPLYRLCTSESAGPRLRSGGSSRSTAPPRRRLRLVGRPLKVPPPFFDST